MTNFWRSRWPLAVVLVAAFAFGGRGIRDESAVMLSGDMARYVMNGVFLYDLVADGGVASFGDLVDYAERYYSRYPALSLGHHPIVPSLALLPFFSVLGISLLAARLAALGWLLLATWGIYRLGQRLCGDIGAFWAGALFVTNHLVLRLGQYVLSELPVVALVLWTTNALFRFCETRRAAHFAWFIAGFVGSLYAKQLAIFMLPTYALIALSQLGWRAFLRPGLVVLTALGAAAILPLVLASQRLAPTAVGFATFNVNSLLTGRRRMGVLQILWTAVSTHISLPIMAMCAAVAGSMAIRRDRRLLIVVVWVASVLLGSIIFTGGAEPGRYSFLAIPAYFLIAGTLAQGGQPRGVTARLIHLTLAVSVAWQFWLSYQVRPSGAGGYEEAAKFIVASNLSAAPVIMYDSTVDTGYFPFFVRKHDPARRAVVLRADKVLPRRDPSAASEEWDSAVYELLKRFGVRMIVVEDVPASSNSSAAFRRELKGSRFVERHRIPIESREPRAQGGSLAVYEYLDPSPPALDTELDIYIRQGRREISLRLRDLIGENR